MRLYGSVYVVHNVIVKLTLFSRKLNLQILKRLHAQLGMRTTHVFDDTIWASDAFCQASLEYITILKLMPGVVFYIGSSMIKEKNPGRLFSTTSDRRVSSSRNGPSFEHVTKFIEGMKFL